MAKLKIVHEKIKEALTRSVAEVYPSRNAFEKALLSGKKLRFYIGFDPTNPNLHLGHTMGLMKIHEFQELGHEIIILIGDFTARIGDPTDKLAVRKPLTKAEVKKNFTTYKKQISKIIHFSGTNPAKVMFNSAWHDKMKFADVLALAENFTVQQMIERDMFQKRLQEQKPIGLHEFLYPVMQGYDSVAMDVDVEVGGSDQIFNMLAGRDLLRKMKGKEKFVVAIKLLEDPASGKKMSKTEHALINISDEPKDMYGKVMALPDSGIVPFFEMATRIPFDEVKKIEHNLAKGILHPKDAKMRLAKEITEMYHDAKKALQAEEYFIATFSKKTTSEHTPELVVTQNSLSLLDLVVFAGIQSKSEAKRLIAQRAVEIDGDTKTNEKDIVPIHTGIILRVGKHKVFKIKHT